MAGAFLLAFLALSAQASGQDYLTDLTANLALAGRSLESASVAMQECNVDLVRCIQDPEGFASEVDAANVDLQSVTANISLLIPPAQYAAGHTLLLRGLEDVSTGLTLYSEGLRERNLNKLSLGGETIRDGRAEIRRATNTILSETSARIDLVPILTIVILVAAGGLAVLLVVLIRTVRRQRLKRVQQELATCPRCGEVLDKWWTYKARQIREWRVTHLKSHENQDNATHH